MRKFLFLSLASMIALSASAQKLTKEEKEEQKEWAKKLKLVTPLDYKRMVEEKAQMEQELQDSELKYQECSSSQATKDAQFAEVKNQLDSLKSVQAAPAPVAVAKGSSAKVGTSNAKASATPTAGIVYKVQIGSFRNKDLSKYFNNTKNFSGDVDADGSKKYTLGEFADYWEADNFKKYLREMGVADAWVVSYKDGVRIEIKQALEGAK